MQILFHILFFLITISSLTISIYAISTIILNDFKGSKFQWIIISMIGIVGPILFLIKGRKLVIKNNPNFENVNFDKQHYIAFIKGIDFRIMVLFFTAITLYVCGHILKSSQIYFFWESIDVGYILFLLSLILIVRFDIKERKLNKVKSTVSKIIFGVLMLLLLTDIAVAIIIPNTDAYEVATKHFVEDKEITSHIGVVSGFYSTSESGIQVNSSESGTSGSASINLIMKGDKKYVEYYVYLEKNVGSEWQIIHIEHIN